MTFPTVRSYASVDPITSLTIPPLGHLFRTPRVNQGPTRGSWIYNFYASGTSTPQNVYQDANLTVPFSPTGQVTLDAFGRAPAIYLDNSVAYKVTLSNAAAVVQQTRDPYNPAMATTGFAQVVAAIGPVINAQGEITLTEAGAGGTGNELSITAAPLGALKIPGISPGVAYIVADTTITTGAQTATFQASNRPGNELQYSLTLTAAPSGAAYTGGTLTAGFTGTTSSLYTAVLSTGQVILGCTLTNGSTTFTCPSTNITGTPTATFVATFSVGVAGWLPIQADGVLYYAPIFRGNSFSPYKFTGNTISASTINAQNFSFNGDGSITLVGSGATAVPPLWFSPPQTGIGANYWVNITRTGGTGGNNFSNAQGAWTNISSGGLNIAVTGGATGFVTGTFQISSSAGGTPVVASGGMITLTLPPLTHTYNTNGSFTDTIPSGTSSVTIENFGASGSGGAGTGSGMGAASGGGGGSGGYNKTVLALTSADWGKTLSVVVGVAGAPSAQAGTASTVSSGTKTITTMTANGGVGGANASSGGAGGAGGTATGGNTTNTTGTSGDTGGINGDGFGGAGVVGTNGTGRKGGNGGFGNGNAGKTGGDGLVVLAYS